MRPVISGKPEISSTLGSVPTMFQQPWRKSLTRAAIAAFTTAVIVSGTGLSSPQVPIFGGHFSEVLAAQGEAAHLRAGHPRVALPRAAPPQAGRRTALLIRILLTAIPRVEALRMALSRFWCFGLLLCR